MIEEGPRLSDAIQNLGKRWPSRLLLLVSPGARRWLVSGLLATCVSGCCTQYEGPLDLECPASMVAGEEVTIVVANVGDVGVYWSRSSGDGGAGVFVVDGEEMHYYGDTASSDERSILFRAVSAGTVTVTVGAFHIGAPICSPFIGTSLSSSAECEIAVLEDGG